jgi:hypothetical protein
MLLRGLDEGDGAGQQMVEPDHDRLRAIGMKRLVQR